MYQHLMNRYKLREREIQQSLFSESDWKALQETLYLTSIPGMRESIKEGLAEPVEKCDTELGW